MEDFIFAEVQTYLCQQQRRRMIPSLQPSRPKVRDNTARSPLYQQQTRSSITGPRSQIEAMPPHRAPVERSALPMPQFDPAVMHPVFFAEAWRRTPFQMPSTGFSPVATGYVFGDNKRKSVLTKL